MHKKKTFTTRRKCLNALAFQLTLSPTYARLRTHRSLPLLHKALGMSHNVTQNLRADFNVYRGILHVGLGVTGKVGTSISQ